MSIDNSTGKRRVAIIGGGISGLSIGSYLQLNGYSTTVYEMAGMVGGVSVAWKRKGYIFDGATNWLPGSGPSLNLHSVVREVLDFDKLTVLEFDEFSRIEHPSGAHFMVYKDVDRLEREMLRIAPEDSRPIRAFTRALRAVKRIQLPIEKAQELYTPLDYMRFIMRYWRLVLFILRWRGMTIEQFARRFTNRVFRDMFVQIFPRHSFFSMMSLALPVGWMCMKTTGYPIGGSNRLADAVADKYRERGGTVVLNAEVDRIIVENGRAVGIVLSSGETVQADIVVSAADGHDTLFNLLEGRYITPAIKKRFESATLYPPMLQISLGLARTFDGLPNKIVMSLEKALVMGTDNAVREMLVRVCSFDPTLAPPGKTSVIVNLRCHDYEFWTTLRENDKTGYAREKQNVADAVIDALDKRLGGVREHLEVCDVATPATYIRYTNIWKGSYQGWAPTPRMVGKSLEKTLPGLRGFYMTGQWVEPAGGLPRAMFSARNVAQIICRDDKRKFSV